MKQRLKKSLAILLAMALLVGLFPAGAFANEPSAVSNQAASDTAVSNETTTPDDDTENGDDTTDEVEAPTYPVADATAFEKALTDIAGQDEEEAVIILQNDILPTTGFVGVAGKRITVRSVEGSIFKIKLGKNLVGDVTLDNVNTGSKYEDLYANGHRFETTENFIGTFDELYGGGSKGHDVEDGTSLTIRGGGIKTLYGGGKDSAVTGSTNIVVDGPKATIFYFFGGGRANETESGTVSGDVNIHLRRGVVRCIVGGGNNEYSLDDPDNCAPATVSGTVYLTTGEAGLADNSVEIATNLATHGGSYHSTVGNVQIQILQGTLNDGDVYGCGAGDIVKGTVSIIIKDVNPGAYAMVYGGGGNELADKSDAITAKIENENKEEYAVTITYDCPEDYSYFEGTYHCVVASGYYSIPTIINGGAYIDIENGQLDYVALDSDSSEEYNKMGGDSLIKITGNSKVMRVAGNKTCYTDESDTSELAAVVEGGTVDAPIEIGQMMYLNDVTLREGAHVTMDFGSIIYNGKKDKPFYSTDALTVEKDAVLTTQNNGQARILNDVTLQGTWDQNYASGNVQPEEDADLQIDGSLTVDGGTLISRGTAHIYNNLDADGGNMAFYQPAVIGMSEEGKGRTFDVSGTNLYLPVIGADDTFYPNDDSLIRLGIGEKATGTANVYLFDGDDYTTQATLTDDNIGQNYINGQHAVSDATFTLANDAATTNGYYFKRVDDTKKTSPTAYDMWQIAKDESQAEPVTITPLTQTIYTGGTDGEGAGDSFPHPIYVKDDGTTVGDDEVFLVDGKEWQSTEENPYPFTVKYYYTDDKDQELTDDAHFGDYEARIVPVDGVDLNKITTKDGAKVDFNSGTLRIRYVSNATEASGNELTSEALFYTDENKDTVRQEVENKANVEPAIILPENTTIYLNGNTDYPYPKENAGAYNISLLFDELLPRTGGGSNQGFIDELIDHAESKGFDLSGKDTDFKYLDLVDSNNSNAWVSSSRGSEVFWPYPEGTDKNDEFQLLHFKGLHREYSMPEEDNIYDQIDASEVEPVEIEKTDAGIWFHVGASGFSPFALVYDKDGGGVTPPPVHPGGGDDDNNPPALNTDDHFSYVVGYEDGMVKPQRNITRAEVSSIFYRLLEDDVRDDNTTDVSEFSDVKASDWYGTTVATLSKMGIVKGYEDGTFRPNAPITRAEFAAIATRFFEETGAEYEPGTFTDVNGDEWFAGAIQDAVNLGLIGGYEDGTVRPNNNITRAEACAIVNRTLGRVPDADHLLPADEMKTWPDNNPSDWFYADMQEATNGHEYEWIKDHGNKVEQWTKIMLDNDWEER